MDTNSNSVIMAKAIIILLFIPSICFGQIDKAYHFTAGTGIGAATYMIVNPLPNVSNEESACIAMFTATMAGVGKELIDRKPDLKDFYYTELGGLVGTAGTYFLTKKYFKRMSIYFDSRTILDKRYNYIGLKFPIR